MSFYDDLIALQAQAGKRIGAMKKLESAIAEVIALESATDAPGIDREKLELLTETEREVFRMMGENLTRDEIVKRLKIEIKTFYKHRDNIRKKLSIETTQELKRLAIGKRKKES